MEGFINNDMRWVDGRLVFPVTDIGYPEGMDELICAVKSKDESRPGWVTMSALEAEGGEYTETVRNATELTFVAPAGYGIEGQDTAEMRLSFRASGSQGASPDWTEYAMPIPNPD